MNAITLMTPAAAPARDRDVRTRVFDDPLDADEVTDIPLVTTERALTRLALVAAETGARFQREALGHDPVAWMLAPRRLFDGEPPLRAVLRRDQCMRAVLLHGLSLGMDAEPATIDALLCDGAGDGDGAYADGGGDGEDAAPIRIRRLRLYSAVLVLARGGELVHLFHASVAPSAATVRERIRSRFGTAAADQAEIQLGVDLSCPATTGLLPPAFRDMVERGRRIRWSALPGLDVTVEHRIPC